MSPTIMQGRLPMTVRIAAMVRALALAVLTALAGVPAFAQMTVSLTAPAAGAVFTTPAYVILTASAQNASGSIARVEFYQGATLIGSDNSASYSVPWPYPSPGSYSLSARAIDAQGVGTTSAPVSVTVVDPVAQVYYIHPDHLNTPRLIADAAGTTVWKWDQQEPFGNDVPNGDPGNTGTTFEFPLRFPGQYYDRETNLAYNYYRDYDPAIGRYIESDPVGLAAGPNTFAYVGSDPLTAVDPFGLYGCVYCVTQHTLTCTPDNPQNPSYTSDAYSSGNNKIPGCRNNPACEGIRGVGPVPRGDYELKRPRSGRPNRLDLRPDPLPRDFIQIHSCANPGSDACSTGCIVSTSPNVKKLLDTLQLEKNNRITVVPSCD